MARPVKRKNGVFYVRQRIPRDVQVKARGHTLTFPKEAGGGGVRITKGAEAVKASLYTREPVVAKERQAAALAYLERYWRALRAGPKHLTQKQIVALGGLTYRWFNNAEDDPGPASLWDMAMRFVREMGEGKHGLADLAIDPTPDEARSSALRFNIGPIADRLLASQALVVDEESRWRVIQELHRSLVQVFEKLKRNAEGDYRPDPMADRFPKWQSATNPQAAAAITNLLAGWEVEARARDLADSTIRGYTSTIRRLIAFLGYDDAARVTEADLFRWKDHRLAEGRSLKTIADSDFACFKAVFGWGKDNRLIPINPAKEINIKPSRKVRERVEQGFTADEARQVLFAALSYRAGEQELAETANAKHWVPWLLAYSGARVGEIAQLRKQDVRKEGEAWVVTITPEAGKVKNKRARNVVLHHHLVELGFPSFAQSAKESYLFVRAHNKQEARGKVQGLKNRLAQFTRAIIKDARVAPNHGWRHRFITVARTAQIHPDIIYAITGHAPANVGAEYGDVTVAAQVKALASFPRYEVDGAITIAAE